MGNDLLRFAGFHAGLAVVGAAASSEAAPRDAFVFPRFGPTRLATSGELSGAEWVGSAGGDVFAVACLSTEAAKEFCSCLLKPSIVKGKLASTSTAKPPIK